MKYDRLAVAACTLPALHVLSKETKMLSGAMRRASASKITIES